MSSAFTKAMISNRLPTANYNITVSASYLPKWIEEAKVDYGIDLQPNFQRPLVWDEARKTAFIEFLLRNGKGDARNITFNSPAFAHTKSEKCNLSNEILLVDGQQRLNAILAFLDDKVAVFDGFRFSDFEDNLKRDICGTTGALSVNIFINALETLEEVLTYYLELNEGGMAHTTEELNRVRIMRDLQREKYHEEETDKIAWKAALLGELDRSIDEQNIWVAYQPKFSAEELHLVGAEALARWDHPTRGSISPDTFIPIAENAGQVEKLTLYLLDRAVREITDIRKRTGKDLSIAVNLSAKMVGYGRLIEPVRATLERHNLPAEALTLELTETAVIDCIEKAKHELKDLRALGVNISIDDYGTGQATPSYLEHIPANELKIDQGFIQEMIDNEDKQKFIASTIALAHDLGMHVVAEGVESLIAQDMLREMKCDQLQGYLLGRPMKSHEFEALAITGCVPKVENHDPKIANIS